MCRSGVVALNYVVSLLYSSVALSLRRWQHGEQKRAPLTLEDHQFSTLWPVSTTILNTGIEGGYSLFLCYSCIESLWPLTYIMWHWVETGFCCCHSVTVVQIKSSKLSNNLFVNERCSCHEGGSAIAKLWTPWAGVYHITSLFVRSGKVEGLRINDPEPKAYTLPHPIWSQEELEGVEITHEPPRDKTEMVSAVNREMVNGG